MPTMGISAVRQTIETTKPIETTKAVDVCQTEKSKIAKRTLANNVIRNVANLGARVCMVLVGTYAAGWAFKEMGEAIADLPWNDFVSPLCDNGHLNTYSWRTSCPSGTLLSQADKLLLSGGDVAIGFGNKLAILGEKMQSLSRVKELVEVAKVLCKGAAFNLSGPMVIGAELFKRTAMYLSKGDMLLPTPVYNFFKRPNLPEGLTYSHSEHAYMVPGWIYNNRFAEGIQRVGVWGDSWIAS